MRVFIGIELMPELRRRLGGLAAEIRPLLENARFVPEENLHLTLRFLGECSAETVGSLAEHLASAAQRLRGFELSFRGSGVFPDRHRPRVLWVGALDPPPALFELQLQVERIARGHGFPPERRRYEPHLTLARFRGRAPRIDDALRAASARELGSTRISEVVIFESRLSPGGSSYHVLRAFPLSGGGS